jgi:hypothetical protein
MSKLYRVASLFFVLCLALLATSAGAQSVFMNEIHYDNVGADADEGVEVAGPAGTDLTGWRVRLYNGADGSAYAVIVLSGVIPDDCNGYGAIWFPEAGLQNGAPDGLALVDDVGGVIQFLSYEGSFMATDMEASGMNSTDIGVDEDPAPALGLSLQLQGNGTDYTDFSWGGPSASSHSACNPLQVFEDPIPVRSASWGVVKSMYR